MGIQKAHRKRTERILRQSGAWKPLLSLGEVILFGVGLCLAAVAFVFLLYGAWR